MAQKTAIVIGAGIVGLATARALAIRNFKVTVIERNARAIGASIRNFGMIWPVGQPDGEMYNRAMQSQRIWKDICDEAGIWYEQKGSLHLAYNPDELKVLQELQEIYSHRQYTLLSKQNVLEKTPAVLENNLMGGLYSPDELVVDPKKAINKIAQWLEEKLDVQFIWGRAVTDIAYPGAYMGTKEVEADQIYVCSGVDFETLYPELFSSIPITRCKLQMMRFTAHNGGYHIGPSLCGALSLLHYTSFKVSPSLRMLRERLDNEFAEHIKWGIHVMVSQNEKGELTIGDSHEYGPVHDPFDKKFINDLILDYLLTFTRLSDFSLMETWNGVYAKMTDSASEFVCMPENGVTIINGLGGAGMTLSFGLTDQIVAGGNSIY
jgi:FAD dependent oxidoreductase TIGR03364